VVPVFNEEENVPVLYAELVEALKTLKQAYEIIFIDDGSTDESRSVLAGIAGRDQKVKVIFFRRNYGQTAALGAGFKYARAKSWSHSTRIAERPCGHTKTSGENGRRL